jgi:hypothetical protein
MLLLVPVSRGRYGHAKVPRVLSRLGHVNRAPRCYRRRYHVQVQGHEAKIQDIRNIGIIAHVDAV